MTSESPPPLRRDFIEYNKEDEDKYAAYDTHFRHTIDHRTNFPRNAPYRSSLQNMTTAPSDFVRNNRYRSTVQNGSMTMRSSDGRYTYGGSITPTPKGRYLSDVTPRMTPGSSMNSISTNPFDDDVDDEMEDNVEGKITSQNAVKSENSLTLSPSSKIPAKKKRRAPPPPTVVSKNISENEQVQIRVNEPDEPSRGLDELSRMTAEFESFVKNSQNDLEPSLIITEEVEKSLRTETKDVEIASAVAIEVEKKPVDSKEDNQQRILEHHIIVTQKTESPDKTIAIVQEDLKIKEIELKIKEDELRIKEALEEVNNNKTLEIEKVVDKSLVHEKHAHQPEEISKNKESTDDIQTVEVYQLSTEIRKFPEIQRITPTSTPSRELTPDFIPLTVREKFDVLRIEENENDLKMPEEVKQEKSMSNIQIQSIEERRESFLTEQPVRTKLITPEPRVFRDHTPIPLARTEVETKLSSQGFIRAPHKYEEFEKCTIRRPMSEENVTFRDDGAPKVPERRRSVKEIIESINRQQQKLKINHPPSPQLSRKKYYFGEQKFSYHEKPALPPKDNVLLKLQRQAESEKRINILLDDLQDYERENEEIQRTQRFPLPDTNNNSLSFPQNNINPIPKPRRVI